MAEYLYRLFTDNELYDRMCAYARDHVSDEVGTVGNALCWLFLANQLAGGRMEDPDSRWVNDMAREGAGLPYEEGETRLPRKEDLNLR